ncbi:hypothetical protein [Methanobacterium oryzae]|uniref:hypothetical protein n=1 Tax=Methanobacterium oryzae TaxID=69540 RepID=UPI003D2226C7
MAEEMSDIEKDSYSEGYKKGYSEGFKAAMSLMQEQAAKQIEEGAMPVFRWP